jgi:iron(III) transport system permease protein
MTATGSIRAYRKSRRSWLERVLSLGALAISLALALPLIAILYLAFFPTENIWPHLFATVLPGYVWRTVALMAGVGLLTFVIGTATAWLVTMLRFPGRRVFAWALLVPLATPTYIIAYTYVDFFAYPGPFQTMIRDLMGWKTPRDYWFPDIRSLGGAILVLSLVLYPYVYLTARTSFMRQSTAQLEVARTLGRSAWGAFFSVALPLARPAIAVGVSLAMMECLNDIGAAGFFGVQTLSLGIYTTWLGQGNLGGAAQIAVVMLVLVFALLWVERMGRHRQAFAPPAQRNRPIARIRLHGWRLAAAWLACFVPIFFGFIVPGLVLLDFALSRWGAGISAGYFRAMSHSLVLSTVAALIAVLMGLALAYANRMSQNFLVRQAIRLSSIGYAVPGTVLGIGVLVPLAGFDNALDAVMRERFGVSTGLLLSGSIAAITFAYVARFLAISFGNLETGLQRVTPSLAAAARTLGRGPLSAFREVHLPMLRPAIVSAGLLVFVDCMKELPATLILRPFDFETLATTVFTLASLDQLEESALPALTIVLAGLIPVILLSRTLRDPKLRPAIGAYP